MRKRVYILLISFLVLINIGFAHSYFYKKDIRKAGDIGWEAYTLDIIGVDLQTGEKEKVFNDENATILSDMSKIIINTIPGKKICIYDTESGNIDTLKNLGKLNLYAAYSVPYNSKEAVYIRGMRDNADDQTRLLIDKNNHSLIDSSVYFPHPDTSVISKDGEKYYLLKKDDQNVYFESHSTNTGEIIDERIPVEEIDINKVESNFYDIETSMNGLIFFGFANKSNKKAHILLYRPSNREVVNYIKRSYGPPYGNTLTENGNMVYIDYIDGYIYIIEKRTLELKQKIKVPPVPEPWSDNGPEHTLFTVDGSLYFIPKSPKNSNPPYHFDKRVSADVTKEQSTSSLISMLSQDVDNYTEKGWISSQQTADDLKEKLNQEDLSGFIDILDQEKGTTINEKAYQRLNFNSKKIKERTEQDTVTIESMIDDVEKYYQNGGIEYDWVKQLLIRHLDHAQTYLENDLTKSVQFTLKLFIRYTKELNRTDHVNDIAKTKLITDAQAIIDNIESKAEALAKSA